MGKPYAQLTNMSSVLLFQRNCFRSSVNIPAGLTLDRKHIVLSVERPWANALARLLTDRRLAKGALAKLADVRPGTISAVANSPKAPDVATLRRLADGFTEHDRQKNPNAPAVELWEFFVSDEQAALLQQAARKHEQLVQEDQLIDRVIKRLGPLVVSELQAELSGAAPQPVVSKGSGKKEHSPLAEDVARGRLHRKQKTA